MIVVRESTEIDLSDTSALLNSMKINELNIYSISNTADKSRTYKIKEPSTVNYFEIGVKIFTKHLNDPKINFLEYNLNSLYILRNANYIEVKQIITKINGYNVNIARGASQKAHILSPLDFRLSCYLMAMFNFNFKNISYLNAFNDLKKNRYLPFYNKY